MVIEYNHLILVEDKLVLQKILDPLVVVISIPGGAESISKAKSIPDKFQSLCGLVISNNQLQKLSELYN